MSKVSLIIFSVLFLLISVSFASLDGDVNTDSYMCAGGYWAWCCGDWFEYDRISSSVQWRRIADSYTEEFYSVISGDFDGDTRADLLVGGDDVVYWYESYQDNQVTLVDSFYVGGKVKQFSFRYIVIWTSLCCGRYRLPQTRMIGLESLVSLMRIQMTVRFIHRLHRAQNSSILA